MTNTIAVIPGDGIGPEIMDATLRVLDAMQLGLQYEFAEAGLAADDEGAAFGMLARAYERTGGVEGAVARLAEEAYQRLSEPEQRRARGQPTQAAAPRPRR